MHQARWNAEDRRIGYSASKREELAAADRELVEALTTTPATTLVGVAGKLDAVLLEVESAEDCTDFRWPQIRSALGDLVRVGRQMTPEQFFPGERRSKPRRRQAAASGREGRAQ